MLAQTPQAGLRIELGRAEVLMPQKFLHLVNRHPRIQQESRHTGPEPVRSDALRQASAPGRVLDHELHRAWGIAGMAVALEQIERLPCPHMGAQLLSERRENGDIPVAASLRDREVDLRR